MRKVVFLTLFLLVTIDAVKASELDPNVVIKARHLVDAIGITKSMSDSLNNDASLKRAGAFLIAKVSAANPGQQDKVEQVVLTAAHTVAPQLLPDFIDYVSGLFAARFSGEELDQLTAYFQTDDGKLFLSLGSQPVDKLSANDKDELEKVSTFLKAGVGKKFKDLQPDIIQNMNLYMADDMRIKRRDLMYAQLREDLPNNGLHVPSPFEPDTYIDKSIHDRAVYENQELSGRAVPVESK